MDWKGRKLAVLKREQSVCVADDEFMEYIEQTNVKGLRSFPNPHQVGTKDKYIVAIIPKHPYAKSSPVLKTVDYSYPTSPNADRLGFKDGCWTVNINCHAIAGFTTKEAAKAYADSLEYIPYGKYTY